MNRERAERAELNSIDPVTRWRAKERAFNRGMAEFSAALMQQAHENAKAAERQEREAQRAEKEFNKNRYKEI